MDEMTASQPPARLQRYAAPQPRLGATKSLRGDDVAMPHGPSTPAASSSRRTSLRSSSGQAQHAGTAQVSAGALAQSTRGRGSLHNQNRVDLCLSTVRHQLNFFARHPDFPEEGRRDYEAACREFRARIETLFLGRQKQIRDEESSI